ncbi:MAG TPA: hypothetical protein PLA27_04165 [Anaerolineales bacterium]|jgi:hypothetical protein|nr:hypothetical protein [Anaerolineales bacterium]HQX15592.1 hypothetical protein [Anaerolineales bacterium]
MNFTDYQTKSRATAKYPVIGHGVIYPTLGLRGEGVIYSEYTIFMKV